MVLHQPPVAACDDRPPRLQSRHSGLPETFLQLAMPASAFVHCGRRAAAAGVTRRRAVALAAADGVQSAASRTVTTPADPTESCVPWSWWGLASTAACTAHTLRCCLGRCNSFEAVGRRLSGSPSCAAACPTSGRASSRGCGTAAAQATLPSYHILTSSGSWGPRSRWRRHRLSQQACKL